MGTTSVWIINPYGNLPGESWTIYRSTMLAECLASRGYEVTQFISNFEHRSKTFRAASRKVLAIDDRYTVQVIPSSAYESHVSVQRIRYERTFARNLLTAVEGSHRPDVIVLAEPSLFYYDILLGPLISRSRAALVLDIIDIWPELFELVIPKPLRLLSAAWLAPLYYWRKRLYRHADAVVAVAEDYLNLAKRLANRPDVIFETVYWSYDNRAIASARDASPAITDLVARKKTNQIWVVYAGTLGENYDITAIADAANWLAADFGDRVDFKFVVAGDGPLKALCEASQSAHFTFLGRLGPADLDVLFRHCDLALTTYKGESTVAMPIKAFDYFFHGLPIVNSLGRDLGRFVRDRRVGTNYDAASPSSLHEAIKRLMLDAELRKTCARNAKILSEEFTPDKQYSKFASVLERLAR